MDTCPKCNTVIADKSVKYCLECGEPIKRERRGSRKGWVVGGVVVGALLIAGLLFFLYGILGRSSRAAAMAPIGTDVFLMLNPDLEQVRNFQRIRDTYLEIPEVKRAVDDLKQKLASDFSLDFETDIKPWLGRELALIVPDLESSDPFDEENAFLLAVATKDQNKTRACMRKLRRHEEESGGSHFETRTYQGVEIAVESNTSPPLVYAIAKGFLLLANDEDLVRSTIDRLKKKDKEVLTRNERYKEVLARLPKSRAGVFYIDRDYLRRLSAEHGEAGEIGEAAGALGVSLSFVPDGVRLDYVLGCDSEKLPRYARATGRETGHLQRMIEMLPDGILACTGSTGLRSVLEELIDDVETKPELEYYREAMNNFEYNTGIDVEQDIVSWMSGECVLVVLPDRNGLPDLPGIPLGFLALIGAEDSQAAGRAMDKIASVVKRYGGEVISDTAGGCNVRYLVPYEGRVVAGYTVKGKNVIIGSSETVLRQVLEGSAARLVNDAAFEKSTGALSFPGDVCSYINVRKGTNWARGSLSGYDREEFDREIYPFLKPVSTITMAVHKPTEKEDFATGALLVRIE